MKKYFAFLSIILFFALPVVAQKLQVEVKYVIADAVETRPMIYYTPGIKLTWNDFKGKPVSNSEASAITNAGIGFKMMFASKDNVATLTIAVNCNFSIEDSWVKSGRKIPYILNHEQHHFDIAYLYAMEFVKNLRAAKYTMKDYSKVIERIYSQCHQDLITLQSAYDTETKNSQLAEQQELWNKKIDAKLDAFAKQ